MRISEEKEKYLDYYFSYIYTERKQTISAIQTMAGTKEQGAGYISCSFNQEEDDYYKGKVSLFFWKPAEVEDTMVLVENSLFYKHLVKVCETHMSKYPKDTEELQGYLNKIKIYLNI